VRVTSWLGGSVSVMHGRTTGRECEADTEERA
jgi:hypothetical protein